MPYPIKIPTVAVYAGDSLVLAAFTLKEDGTPVDFSGWTLVAQWRKSLTATGFVSLYVDKTDAATGRLIVSATAAQTRAMGQSGVWDLQGTQGSNVRTFVSGRTTYKGDVSRDA